MKGSGSGGRISWDRNSTFSGGRISWDQNSTFSGGRIFDHEIEIPNNELLQNWSGDRIGPGGP